MTINQFIRENRKGHFAPDVVCKDGFRMSVQAGGGHRCTWLFGSLCSAEVAFPSRDEPLLDRHMDADGVAGWTPVEVIDAIIEKHGGLA